MASTRPGMPSVSPLPQDERRVMEPIVDLVGRITGATVRKIDLASEFDAAYLTGAATLVDVINRVNQLHFEHNAAITKINEIISRLQED